MDELPMSDTSLLLLMQWGKRLRVRHQILEDNGYWAWWVIEESA